MATLFDRKIFFDGVRATLFSGSLSQQQVDGMNAILDGWELHAANFDLRWLAYMLATTYHETAQKMWPIEEYGKGAGMAYGKPDPETGQTYYGRGYVQLTWRDNYARADRELDLSGDRSCEWHAENALEPDLAAWIMGLGMIEGWFRSDEHGRQDLPRYFSPTVDDPFGAREIINGDKKTVPSWSNGVSIGKLVEGYHDRFHDALEAALVEPEPEPEPEPEQVPDLSVVIALSQPGMAPPEHIKVSVTWNGEVVA